MIACLSSVLVFGENTVVPAGVAGVLVVAAGVEHTVFEIDPDDPVNIPDLDAFE